ncbi:MAG TPA: cytochrome P460 family protein [Blastocatellia bacterium]
MKKRRITVCVVVATAALAWCLCAFAGPGNSKDDGQVPFPKGYRMWVHVKSTVVTPQHVFLAKPPCEKPCVGGIFHFYANEKAIEGYRTGKFPDGAMIADDLTELVEGGGHSTPEGKLRLVSVMVKDSQRYSTTGGWGFESFTPGSEVGVLNESEKAACFACHAPRKDQDYVFTKLRE